MKPGRLALAGLAITTFALGLSAEPDVTRWTEAAGPFTATEARVGRPATPLSVAGVARRTTRRVVRRTAVVVSTLPAGCASATINGAGYYQCGSTYYEPQGNTYVVVNVE